MRPQHVVIVVQNLPVPFDRRVWLEATTLREEGYEVTCICPKAKGFNASREVLEGINIERYKIPLEATGPLGFAFEFIWCFFRVAAKLSRIAARGKLDILHVCNPPETYFPLGWLMRLSGRKFLFDHHDLSPEMFDAKFAASTEQENPGPAKALLRRGLVWCEKMTFRAANLVITTNQSHKKIAIERGGMAADDVIVVRSGPDLERLTATDPEPHWRNGKAHLIAYLGEICEQDGVDHLVAALKHIRDEHQRDDIHCVFIGGGPHQPMVKAYADELGVDELCNFVGRVPDEQLCEILSSADLGVDPDPLTSWSDKSTMNKIMEYMFFELPIVSYDLTEARVSAQEAALYVESNKPEALARGIIELLDDADRRREMGKLGRARIENELSWEHSKPHLLAAYTRLSKA